MTSTSKLRLTALLAVLAASGTALAQTPVFVAIDAQPLGTADIVAGSPIKVGRGSVRAAPVLMETRGHVHADGSVSTSCAAIPSAVPHAVAASREITKQQER